MYPTILRSSFLLSGIALSLATSLVACVDAVEPTPSPGDLDGKADDDDQVGSDETDETPDETRPLPVGATVSLSAEGCTDFAHNLSGDQEAFTVTFDGLIAEGERTVDCTVTLDYTFPAGWRLVAPRAYSRGFIQLDDGASLAANLTVAIDGRVAAATSVSRAGELSEDSLLAAEAQPTRGTDCGATSATIQVHLTGTATGAGAGFFDSLDGESKWEQCE